MFIGWTVSRAVTHSLGNVRNQLHELAAGEGDLTKRLITSDDEVGLIASEVNGLMEKLLILVKRVQESGIQVTSVGDPAQRFVEGTRDNTHTTSCLHQRSGLFREGNIGHDASACRARWRTWRSSPRRRRRRPEAARPGLMRMGATMEKMATASTAIAQKLADINAKVTNITSVVTTINKVADQTNLLSSNAAIEAAKAGEFGQGFAVVAREIRRLADQTAIATLDIEQMVKEMQSSVSSGVMGMEKFAQEVQSAVREVNEISGQIARIIDQVQGLGPRFESVNEGMESQSVGARQITEAMIQLSEATRNTAESQRDAVRAIELLDQAARVLHREVSRFNVNASSSSSAGSARRHQRTGCCGIRARMVALLFEVDGQRYGLDVTQVLKVLPYGAPAAASSGSGVCRRCLPIPGHDGSRHRFESAHSREARPSYLSTRIILVRHPGPSGQDRVLGLLAERATDSLELARPSRNHPALRCRKRLTWGASAPSSGGIIQYVKVENLLREDLRERLFVEE